MKNGKRSIAILICLIMCAALLAACGDKGNTATSPSTSNSPEVSSAVSDSPVNTPSTNTPQQDGSVKYADHLEIIMDSTVAPILNPLSAAGSGNTCNWSYRMMYDTLFEFNVEDGSYMPMLATSCETEDYQTFIVKLRDDVYFHSGDKFTADDVVYTAIQGRDAKGAPCYDYWVEIEEVKAIDDTTVEFKLFNANMDFQYGISLSYMAIVNGRSIEKDEIKGYWDGTGAYKIADFSMNDFVAFERNDDYWGELPITKTMTWRNVPEISTRAIMMQSGEGQLCFEVSEGDLTRFMADKDNYVVFPVTINNPTSLHLNQSFPLTNDPDFRMAIAHAIDKPEIALFAGGELAKTPPDDAVWGLYTKWRNTDIEVAEYNLEKAKEYLEKSSYKGETIELTTALTYNIKAAETLQEQLAKIGITITINQMDQPSFTSYTVWSDNKAHMSVWSNLLGAIPVAYRNNFYPGSVHNRSMLVDDELTELFDKVSSVYDEAERESIYKRMQEIVADHNNCIALFYRTNAVVAAKGVDGCRLYFNTLYDMRYTYQVLDS